MSFILEAKNGQSVTINAWNWRPTMVLAGSPSSWTKPIDANEVYSATYEWLITFRDFSRASGGFNVY